MRQPAASGVLIYASQLDRMSVFYQRVLGLREVHADAVHRVLASADGADEVREVTIMGDKSVPYAVLKKVMATCTDADYSKVSLAVVEKESVAGGATA